MSPSLALSSPQDLNYSFFSSSQFQEFKIYYPIFLLETDLSYLRYSPCFWNHGLPRRTHYFSKQNTQDTAGLPPGGLPAKK